MALTDNGF